MTEARLTRSMMRRRGLSIPRSLGTDWHEDYAGALRASLTETEYVALVDAMVAKLP